MSIRRLGIGIVLAVTFALGGAAQAQEDVWKRVDVPDTKLSLQVFGELQSGDPEDHEDSGPMLKRTTTFAFAAESETFACTITVCEGESGFKVNSMMLGFFVSGLIDAFQADSDQHSQMLTRQKGKAGDVPAATYKRRLQIEGQEYVERTVLLADGARTIIVSAMYAKKDHDGEQEAEKVIDSIYYGGNSLSGLKDVDLKVKAGAEN